MNKDVVIPEPLWAGTEHSLMLAMQFYAGLLSPGSVAARQADSEEDLPWNYQRQGNIGVVAIKGSLVNREVPWYARDSATGYPDIRNAMVFAAQDSEVEAIVLDVNSGGGAVSGVADTADLISLVDSKVKPVYAITDGSMASAAYWIGSSAREVYGSKTSLVGSVGVIMTHMEVSGMLEKMGIKANVLRSGEYKALLNQFEPATKRALDQAQAQLDATYGIFIGHVAARRGVSIDVADQQMGQGREFIGQDAVRAGLVDGLMTFDALLGKIGATLLDTRTLTQNNSGNYQGMPMKKALTEVEIAALASGATTVAQTSSAASNTPAAEVETTTTEQPAATETAAAAAEVTQEQTGNDQTAVVSLLFKQLADAQAELVTAKVSAQKAETELTELKALVPALTKIAADSVSNMRVALGLTSIDLSAMSAQSLLVEHSSTKETFTKAFKARGVAAVSLASEEVKSDTVHPGLEAARVAATRVTTPAK